LRNGCGRIASDGMRIAFITTEYITEPLFAGGLANYTYRVARALRELGHDVEVFVPGKPEASFEHDGVAVHRLKLRNPVYLRVLQRLLRWWQRYKPWAGYIDSLKFTVSLRAGLKKRNREQPFDLVHYTHLLGTGALRSGVPSVVRLSSYRDLWVPFGFHFTSRFQGFLEDMALKRADAVFAPSEHVANYVQSKLHVPVTIIESPCPLPPGDEDASVWEKHLGSRKPYGLYFGSLAEWKGVFVLAEALKTFLAEHEDLHFVFVGNDLSTRDGKPASEFILQGLVDFKNRVMRLESMPHAQLFPIIRNADFVALPSLAENFPNTCIEAMMLGKIVLGTRGHGFDQLIQDGKTGLLCEPGDVDSLTNALRRAATLSQNDKDRMGKLARERIDRLAPEKVVIELLSFYEEVINRKRRRYRLNLFRRFKANDSGPDRHRATSSVIIDDR
jgi:glycosyltransferase involved in cell wall biosynthesis